MTNSTKGRDVSFKFRHHSGGYRRSKLSHNQTHKGTKTNAENTDRTRYGLIKISKPADF